MRSTLSRVLAATALTLSALGIAGGTVAVSAASASAAARPSMVYVHG